MTNLLDRERGAHADPDDFLDGKRWTFMAATVFFVLVLGAAAGTVIARHHHPAGPPPGGVVVQTPAPGPSSAPTASTTPASPIVALPLTTAPPVSWQLWKAVAFPSGVDGPRALDTRQGYRQTPAGAVLAAVNGLLRANRGTAAEQRAAIAYAFTPGAVQASLLKAVPIEQLVLPGQVAGFRQVTWTPTASLVSVAVRYTNAATGQSGVQGVELPMLWRDGDWRLTLTLTAPPTLPLPTLDGYIPFSGVS